MHHIISCDGVLPNLKGAAVLSLAVSNGKAATQTGSAVTNTMYSLWGIAGVDPNGAHHIPRLSASRRW